MQRRHERVVERTDVVHRVRPRCGLARLRPPAHSRRPLLPLVLRLVLRLPLRLHLLRHHVLCLLRLLRLHHLRRRRLHRVVLRVGGLHVQLPRRGRHHLRLRELGPHLHLRRPGVGLVVRNVALLAHVRLRAAAVAVAVLCREVREHLHCDPAVTTQVNHPSSTTQPLSAPGPAHSHVHPEQVTLPSSCMRSWHMPTPHCQS